jgi:hypothetical protein
MSALSSIALATSRWVRELSALSPYAIGGLVASLVIFLPTFISVLWTRHLVRLSLVFLNQEPFVISTPTITMDGRPGPQRTYVRVFPRCSDPIPNCEAFLIAIHRWDHGQWTPLLNEACPLTFANRGVGPLTVTPLVGPYVDVFYVEQNNDQLTPCIPALPLRLMEALNRSAVYRFDIQVDGSQPIFLRAEPGATWDRPLVTVVHA